MCKILIAVPCMDTLPARFAHSLVMLRKVGECAVTFEIGSLIYTSRNNIAKRAIEMGADFVLWLDSDMVFEPDLLERLMAHMDNKEVSMVTGVYYRRVAPFSPTLFDRLDYHDGATAWTEFKEIPDKLFTVGGCGFGCVLMRVEVLFDVAGRYQSCFAPLGNTGEDLAFCWRARQCGHQIYCDPTIQCGHEGRTVITKEFYESYRLSESN